jgi:Protein of unknown function (DUF1553)/Protein of unknown function (DUF1549)/Planctomycete cytochrome C
MIRGLTAFLLLATVPPAAAAEPDYLRDIKPLLKTKCYACHGAVRQKAGLRLDAGQLVLKGGKRGEVVVPGKPDQSTLIEMITAHGGERAQMPPEGEGEALSEKDIELFRLWVKNGAKAPTEPVPDGPQSHWAYQPPRKTKVPGPGNPVDAFLSARRAKENLTTNPEADRLTLLRRVTLDLIGIPPTSDEMREFLNDSRPDAYEKVVDRLLASPMYGERWGRHWMDVWRYSDPFGSGDEYRYSQRHIWRWRDWIVESLNADKGYDRMIVEMLAGDEIAPRDRDTLRATGYLARNWYKFNRNAWIQDSVEYTAAGFLGITMRCARCHDHKYDPISQTDYYRFRAFFEPHDVRIDPLPGQPDVNKDGVARVFDKTPDVPTYLYVRGDERSPDKSRVLPPDVPRVFGDDIEVTAIKPTRQELAGLLFIAAIEANRQTSVDLAAATSAAERAESVAAEVRQRAQALAFADKPRLAALRYQSQMEKAALIAAARVETARAAVAAVIERFASDAAHLADPPVSTDMQALALAAAKAERRVAALKAAEAVLTAPAAKLATAKKTHADALAAVAKDDSTYTPLLNAEALTSTGRRLALAKWIADTKNPLTARVAVNHIWMRHFGTPLVPPVANFGLNGKPPTHPELLDWLAAEFAQTNWSMKHLHRLIVTSRTYRLSSRNADGPNKLADPENRLYWRANSRRMDAEVVRDSLLAVAGQLDRTLGGPVLDEKLGLTSKRRSLYFRFNAEYKMSFLDQFDAASPTECYERRESVVPQQALALHNSGLALNVSREVAKHLAKETDFVPAAFERLLGRAPTEEEQQRCVEFLHGQSALYATPEKLTPFPPGPAVTPPSTDPAQRAREDLIHVLLNHNDFITVR